MVPRADRLLLVSLLAGVALVGCEPVPPRLKGIESFQSATTPNPPPTWKGDKYASGGIASATGGLNTKNTYSKGSKEAESQWSAESTPPGTTELKVAPAELVTPKGKSDH